MLCIGIRSIKQWTTSSEVEGVKMKLGEKLINEPLLSFLCIKWPYTCLCIHTCARVCVCRAIFFWWTEHQIEHNLSNFWLIASNIYNSSLVRGQSVFQCKIYETKRFDDIICAMDARAFLYMHACMWVDSFYQK